MAGTTALVVGQARINLMTNPANKLVTRLQLSAQGTVRRVVEHVRARYMAILEIELPDESPRDEVATNLLE